MSGRGEQDTLLLLSFHLLLGSRWREGTFPAPDTNQFLFFLITPTVQLEDTPRLFDCLIDFNPPAARATALACCRIDRLYLM